MAFQIHIAGAEELSRHQFLTEVRIERPLYAHARAHVVLRWQEGSSRYGQRQTALTAARILNCPLDVQWKDNDLAESVDCFHGYIENVSARRDATSSWIVIDAVSFSRRTDLVPRYRTFQATTLLDIAEHVARTEPLVKIARPGDLSHPIALSVQHAETDFAYLSRMMHNWGVPMAVRDRTGEVILGARGAEASAPFPDINFGWAEVAFQGALKSLPDLAGGGSGPTGLAREAVQALQAQVPATARDYYAIPDHPAIRETTSRNASQVDTSGYHLRLDGLALPFSPGEVVEFEGHSQQIRHARITGDPQQTTAQQFWLQPLTLPLRPERPPLNWPSRAVWAHVTANEQDPLHQGRIQVEFEWEHMDPQPSGERAWLHTLTPYGGGAGGPQGTGAKSTSYNGLTSVPEIGERVLVEFLGDWDSEAVIIGAIREGGVPEAHNQHNTKRWRTPSGNEVSHHTLDGYDNTRILTRDMQMLMTEVAGGGTRVTLINAGQPDNIVHMETQGGASRVYISSGNVIHVTSGSEIHVDSTRIKIAAAEDLQIYAKNVRIAAAEDMQMVAGKRAGLYSTQDMTVATQSNLHVGAKGSAQVGADAHMQLNGKTLQVESTGDTHIDAQHVNVNTGPMGSLPKVEKATIGKPPAPPPAPTFSKPHP